MLPKKVATPPAPQPVATTTVAEVEPARDEAKERADVLEAALKAEQDRLEELEAQFTHAIESLPFPLEALRLGLGDLGIAPDSQRYVYQKLALPLMGLGNIDPVRNYPHLTTLELPGNNITDILPLGSLRYLVLVDLSNNKLTGNLKIDPAPFNLQFLDVSRNQITNIDHLAVHRFLTKLNLDRNLLKDISPLSKCRYLQHLSCVKNGMSSLDALRHLPLKTLDLSWNRLTSLAGVETLTKLESITLVHNSIESLHHFSSHPSLSDINMESNLVKAVREIETLASIRSLRSLKLTRNPVCLLPPQFWMPSQPSFVHNNAKHLPAYRLRVVFMVPRLVVLDSMPVTAEEKVAGINTYYPPPKVIQSSHRILAQKKLAKAFAKVAVTNSPDTSLRPIVIFGPTGSGKRTLTRRLLQDYPHLYGVSVSHTTRKPRYGEQHGVHYHFVTPADMDRMQAEGRFVSCVALFGNRYATSLESIERVTAERKVCVLDLEFEGVRAIRKLNMNARYIFVTTPSIAVLEQRLNKRLARKTLEEETPQPEADAEDGSTVEQDISHRLNKAQLSGDGERCDLAIVNNDLEEAYRELRDYCLGVYFEDLDRRAGGHALLEGAEEQEEQEDGGGFEPYSPVQEEEEEGEEEQV